MTKQEAIRRLKECKRMYTLPMVIYNNYDFRYRSYANTLISFLIRRIEESSGNDPIGIIRYYKMELDYLIGDSKNSRTWAFCSIMRDICNCLIIDIK